MKKQILLPTSVKSEMLKTFGIGRDQLRDALIFETNSQRAKMLRAAALERGGLIYTGKHAPRGYLPAVKTSFDHVRNIMRQSFGERVALEIDKTANIASIFIDNEHVATFEDVTLDTWTNVLYSLQKIYNQLNA